MNGFFPCVVASNGGPTVVEEEDSCEYDDNGVKIGEEWSVVFVSLSLVSFSETI